MQKKRSAEGGAKAKPVVRQTLSEQIYQSLKQDIIMHQIPFGEKLVNRDLQTRFGVSSTPIRDAINHLYLDGLLENITNGGARVVSFDMERALEINEVVMVLSLGAIESIVRNGRMSELADMLKELIEHQSEVETMEDYIELDARFHRAFFVCSGNRHLSQIYDQYTVLFEILVRLAKAEGARRRTRMQQHEFIYELCRSGDVLGLKHAVKVHYNTAAEWFTQNASAFEA